MLIVFNFFAPESQAYKSPLIGLNAISAVLKVFITKVVTPVVILTLYSFFVPPEI